MQGGRRRVSQAQARAGGPAHTKANFAATGLDGSAFDTTYCDETLRISRGGNPLRGELRVFTRVAAPAPPSPEVADEDRFIVAPDMEGDPEDSMPSD